MLVPADDDSRVSARLEEATRRLAPLLAHGWAAMGTSGPAAGAAGLRRSLDEARHAHGIARIRTGTVRTATADDLSSHLLLLADARGERPL